jgi:uncharacterized membrane-anchored protein
VSARERIAFFALVALQAVFPLGMVAANEAHLAGGDEIRLRAVPVDPHDPFRGEYVELRYEITQLPIDRGAGPSATVYVVLDKTGERWTGREAVVGVRPEGEPVIRGTIVSASGRQAQIEYGIESYFVEEGDAVRYERAIQSGDLYVDVVLDDSGQAKIKDVVVD